jgi:hypothetical protein
MINDAAVSSQPQHRTTMADTSTSTTTATTTSPTNKEDQHQVAQQPLLDKKTACFCNWKRCVEIESLLQEHALPDDPWRGPRITIKEKSSSIKVTALRSCVAHHFQLNGGKTDHANKCKNYVIARHHFPRSLFASLKQRTVIITLDQAKEFDEVEGYVDNKRLQQKQNSVIASIQRPACLRIRFFPKILVRRTRKSTLGMCKAGCRLPWWTKRRRMNLLYY